MQRNSAAIACVIALAAFAIGEAAAQDTIPTTRPREAPADAQRPAVPEVSTLQEPRPQAPNSSVASGRPALPVPVPDAFVRGVERLSRESGPLTQAADIEWSSRMIRRFPARPLDVERVTVSGISPCQGYFGTEPALVLNAEFLRPVRISTESSGDTMLLIRLPDGFWLCDDDSGEGLIASIDLTIGGPEPWLVHVGYYEDYLITPEVTVLVEPDPSLR